MRLNAFLLLGFLVFSAVPAGAQQNTGSLSGTVTDPNAAVIPAAKVTATNLATGLKTETVTTDAGLYVFASLPIGIYEVSVEKTGFKRLIRSNLEIRVAQRLVLDVQLEIGDVQQTIEVAAQAPLLETANSERGQSFSNKFMDTLPLFTGGIRNAEAFVTCLASTPSAR